MPTDSAWDAICDNPTRDKYLAHVHLNNSRFVSTDGWKMLQIVRDIKPGEILTATYGYEYWMKRLEGDVLAAERSISSC